MIEMLYGLQVIDDEAYDAYRAAMKPILYRYGGDFVVDVRVAEVLRPDRPFNRLFTMRFPSFEQKEAFFADPAYLEARARHFVPAVASVSELGRYQLA